MQTAPSHRLPSFAVLSALSLVVGLQCGTARAADGNPATSNLMSQPVVPYEGFLMLDGQPVTGTHWMRFDLWGDPSSTQETQLRYAETQQVQFFNGRFSVAIGAGSPITIGTRTPSVVDAILDGDRLYLGIHMGGRGEGSDAPPLNTYVSLSGRQAIEAVPYSAWSANAADMTVARVLKSNYFLPTYGNWPPPTGQDTGGAAIINDNSGYQALMIVGNNSADGSTRRIEMFDDVDVGAHLSSGSFTSRGQVAATSFSTAGAVSAGSVSATGNVSGGSVSTTGAVSGGSISTSGNITADSNTRGTCAWTAWRQKAATNTNGSGLICSDNRFVAGVDFYHPHGQDYTYQEFFRLYCCEL